MCWAELPTSDSSAGACATEPTAPRRRSRAGLVACLRAAGAFGRARPDAGRECGGVRAKNRGRRPGWAARGPRAAVKKGKAHKIYPYLLSNLLIDKPNQVFCTDITYIRMQGGFVYLVAVMDWYSRKVLSWELSNTMDDSFCVSALECAIRLYGVPDIFNTDQGAQFTGKAFIKVLVDNEIKISMDGKGRWVDNVFIERLWRSVKYEDVYIKEYPTVIALRSGLREYFQFYNDERPHDSLDKCTPSEFYNGLRVAA